MYLARPGQGVRAVVCPLTTCVHSLSATRSMLRKFKSETEAAAALRREQILCAQSQGKSDSYPASTCAYPWFDISISGSVPESEWP